MLLATNFVSLFVESAPYLLLGMLIAGIIHQLLPNQWIVSTLGGKNAVFTAAFVGAPLPLCSCSVIPVAMGIRRNGASKASTASFLVSTPETGIDSIGITYALMGLPMAIARPIAAIFSAIITGLSIAAFGTPNKLANAAVAEPSKSCCDFSAPEIIPVQTSCCETKPAKTNKAWNTTIAIFEYGFGKILIDFMKWLLIGLFFAALVLTYVPENWMASYGSGPLAMILMVVVSIPMYICATASTPIAVGLMLAGISPGAALVFMLTGPATNIATLMIIRQELGTRELGLYLVSLIGCALLSGWVVDVVFSYYSITMVLNHGQHSDMSTAIHQIGAVILAMLLVWQMVKIIKGKMLKILPV
ncbi:MAG: uncharacterized membrane protein YraQ (UPF0718 family) [Alphaproteobacteria bacterium]|jgi:uncharacterized membrane protein YraQ (UPF0718 family)